jgi:hypothetical protein
MADKKITEPDNSTVDDWFGQNVARDADTADEIAQEHGTGAEAQERFDREAKGKERYDQGHRRP